MPSISTDHYVLSATSHLQYGTILRIVLSRI